MYVYHTLIEKVLYGVVTIVTSTDDPHTTTVLFHRNRAGLSQSILLAEAG